MNSIQVASADFIENPSVGYCLSAQEGKIQQRYMPYKRQRVFITWPLASRRLQL